MHTAVVTSWGSPPTYTKVSTPPAPDPSSNLLQLRVLYAGLHSLVRSRAVGTHYSNTSASSAPVHHIPGIDGVGTTPDGKHFYFVSFGPQGTFSEYVSVPKESAFPLPEGLDPLVAAAYMNPALGSWMALRYRTVDLPEAGWGVLIVGATSASGRVAAQTARALGATRVVGLARNVQKLEQVEGLDVRVALEDDVAKTDFQSIGHVDVVLDFVYGRVAEELFKRLSTETGPVQYVQVGALSGQMEVNLPSAVLRSKDLTVRGAGPGAWPMAKMSKEIPAMLEVLKAVKKEGVDVVRLSDVEEAWNRKSDDRVVFQMA